jgi:hypothetical protein
MSTCANRKDAFSVLGIGVAACAACCIGPIVVFFGGLGVLGALSTIVVGMAGIGVALAAGTAHFVLRRRQREAACSSGASPAVAVEAPLRR